MKPARPPKAKAMLARAPRRDAGRSRGAPVVDRVLEEAISELSQHGLEGFSVEQVARRAELNKTSVYRRWPTKEAIVADALASVRDDLQFSLGDHGSLRDDLLALGGDVARVVTSDVGKALLRAAFTAHGSRELHMLATSALSSSSARDAAGLVARAKRRGEWRRGLAPRPLLSMLVGAIVHRVMLEQAPADRRFLSHIVDVMVRGVAPTPKRPRSKRASP